MTSRDKVVRRSGGRCEAMVLVNGVWTRCWDRPVEVHHVLTKARGGRHLDALGEDYHLMALCRYHHQAADGGEAYAGGLLIDGYVNKINGETIYYGSNEYLRRKYGGEFADETDKGKGFADNDAAGALAESS
jgi:hypothetical protein